MAEKKTVKSAVVKPAAPKKVNMEVKPDTFTGKSPDLSFKKALKDALLQAGKLPEHCKYEILKMEYEKGGAGKASNLLVTIKKVMS